jgi:hypothetical protein
LKIPNIKKRAGRVAQVAEHLPSKREALNSKSIIAKKRKERKKGRKKEKSKQGKK